MSSYNLREPRKRMFGNGLRGRDSVDYRISEDQTDEGESRARRRVAFEKQPQKPKVMSNMEKGTSILDRGKESSLPEQEGAYLESTDEGWSDSDRSSMETMRYNSAPRDLRRLQARVPSPETTIRNLEHENHELRRSFDYRHTSNYGGDAMRRLRNKNTKLMDENDSLLARIRHLERDVRDGVGNDARKFMEEISTWRRRYDKLSYTVDGLQNDLAVATDRNRRLEEACELRARNERKAMRDIDRYKAILRQNGLR